MTKVKLEGTEQIAAFVRDHGGIGALTETTHGTIGTYNQIASMTLSDGSRLVCECTGIAGDCSTYGSYGDEATIEWYGEVSA